ncbi:MAG: 50S ribosomal protein L4 [Candidatus Altiarchaeales archaeon]|nr:50S ribosomal protein L4 [Candidatus Altiarchaeales archaeon]
MKAQVMKLTGTRKGDIKLPEVFNSPYRPDLIQRAYVSLQANNRRKYGTNAAAGLLTSADYFGSRRNSYRQTINRGMTRLPREKPGGGGLGKVRKVPQAVGGRRAHPPTTRKDHSKKINKKEYKAAIDSAIAACANKKIVSSQYLADKTEYPLVVEDGIQKITQTKKLAEVLDKLGFTGLIASKRRHRLLIVAGADEGLGKASSNLPGVDFATVNQLDMDLLAPGNRPGRVVLWTEQAVKKLGGDS